jgi:MFS transporter, FHS family, Na+ dependent glucose transporter 1
MIGSLAGGSGLDRFSGNFLVAAALLVMGGSLVTVPLLGSLILLVIAFLIVGIGGGVVEVGGNTLLIWCYGQRVGPWMNALHFAFGIGAMLSPFLIGQALSRTGTLPPAFLLAALLMIPGALVLFASRSPPAPAHRETGNAGGDAPAIILVSLFLLLYIGAESSFGGWIYSWSVKVHQVDPAVAATLTSLFWAMIMTGRLLAIPLSTRFKPRTILIGTVIGAVASVVLLSSPAGGVSRTVLWIATAGTGLSMAAVFPAAMSFAGANLNVTGSSSRWFFIGSGAGGMTIPWAMGHLLDVVGPGAVMPAIVAVLLLMGVTLVVLLVRLR